MLKPKKPEDPSPNLKGVNNSIMGKKEAVKAAPQVLENKTESEPVPVKESWHEMKTFCSRVRKEDWLYLCKRGDFIELVQTNKVEDIKKYIETRGFKLEPNI
jgi:predicted sulfurtransferase